MEYFSDKTKELIARGDKAFSNRNMLMSHWQNIAEMFHPSRADFTRQRNLGDEFMQDLTTSTTVQMASNLSDIFTTMTRPSGQKWFKVGVSDYRGVDNEGHVFLEWATDRLRAFMLNKDSGFARATKEADYDMVSFGNSVKSLDYNKDLTGLLFRNWHLKDVCWYEGYNKAINEVHRNWTPTVSQLVEHFPATVHAKVKECLAKEPHREIKCRHIVVPYGEYSSKKNGKAFEYLSLYVDVENNCVLEEVGSSVLGYIIPRWATTSNSPYGYSPAVLKALPDGRLLNQIALTLLEAGQKAVDPPMWAVEEAMKSNINIGAGGITYVSLEAMDGKQSPLNPISVDKTGLAFGLNLSQSVTLQIFESFYLNKLNLPSTNGGMSPFEVSQRIQEFVRNAYPLFQPIEVEDNNVMCEMSFKMLLNQNAFGDPRKFPQSMLGKDINFTFDNPLVNAKDQEFKQAFMEGGAIIAQTAQIDPNITHIINVKEATRDVLRSVGFKASWMNGEAEMKKMAEEAQMAQQMAQLQQGAMVAQDVGNAGLAMKKGFTNEQTAR